MAKKEPKVKKPKKEKKPKKGGELAESELEAGGKKRKGPPLFLIIGGLVLIAAIALVVVFVVLPRLNGEPDEPDIEPEPSDPAVYYELPENFAVGEESVPAPVPLIAANVQAIKAVQVIYTYVDLTDAGAETENYVSKLVSEEKFHVVNEEFVRTDAPDYTTPEGEVLLAKNLPKPEVEAEPAPTQSTEEETTPPAETEPEEPVDMVLTVRVSWQPGMFVVVSDQEEGKVTSPPRGEGPTSGGAMSLNGALDYMKSLSPSVLGLSGDSMEGYRVYALDGSVMVNGQPCMRMKVYSRNEAKQTNEFVGTYFLSNDGKHLFRLNEEEDRVTELELP